MYRSVRHRAARGYKVSPVGGRGVWEVACTAALATAPPGATRCHRAGAEVYGQLESERVSVRRWRALALMF